MKFPSLKELAKRAYLTYIRSLAKQGCKEIFENETKFPFDEFALSLGLPMTPRIRKLDKINRKVMENILIDEDSGQEFTNPENMHLTDQTMPEPEDDIAEGFLQAKDTAVDEIPHMMKADTMYVNFPTFIFNHLKKHIFITSLLIV